jgi:DNA end-binding protein Ku
MQLIDQISEDTYDPTMFEDEEKKRILAAIDEKIAGKQVVAMEPVEPQPGGQVIDLMEALRASLGTRGAGPRQGQGRGEGRAGAAPAEAAKERKGVKRAPKVAEEAAVAAPARARAKK